MPAHDWSAFHTFLRDKEHLLITTHRNPDGDAIGSEIALMHYLRRLGKTVDVINSDPTPKYFRFLDPGEEVRVYDPAVFAELLPRLHGGIVVDISDWARLADLGRAVQKHGLPLACIDHHIPSDHLGEVQVIDTQSSSTGELIFDLIERCKSEYNQEMIDALYTCILTDTGSFRFSNTTPKTHRNAARLLSLGARFREVYRHVHESYSANRIHLAGRLMANMRFECQGRLAWVALPQDLLRQSRVQAWETEGLSELPRSVEGVELSLMFSETSDGTTKISFRSAGRIAINGLAATFGGGGHKYAAGATVNEPLETVQKQVLEQTRSLLRSHDDESETGSD